MIKTRHMTDTAVYNSEIFRTISKEAIITLFKNNKYTFFNGSQITFKPIGYVNNDFYQVKIDNNSDKRFLNQLNIINTKKIINDMEYQIAMDLQTISIIADINKQHKVIINDNIFSYSIKELAMEFLFDNNTELKALKEKNVLQQIGYKTVIVEDDLKADLLKVRDTNLFNVIHSYNVLKCYQNRLDNLIYGGI